MNANQYKNYAEWLNEIDQLPADINRACNYLCVIAQIMLDIAISITPSTPPHSDDHPSEQ
jgi:hypothetical protein